MKPPACLFLRIPFVTILGGYFLATGIAVGHSQAADPHARPRGAGALTFQDRVAAQRAVEEILWQHRIWPKENPGPKPRLSAVLSEAAIREKVSEYLKESDALDKIWHRPIRSEQLQAEMARMARETRQPAVLRELFAALHDDPTVIAECLARPAVADRLVHTAYGGDAIHSETRRKAQEDLARHPSPDGWKNTGGRYLETSSRRLPASTGAPRDENGLTPDEYQSLLTHLREQVDPAAAGTIGDSMPLPIRRAGPLREMEDSFAVTAVLAQDADSIRVATLQWDKKPFSSWWTETKSTLSDQVAISDHVYATAEVQGSTCTDNTWRATTASPPLARYNHVAVWTGSEMIVWGGEFAASVTPSGSGGRYDPTLDLWSPTFDDRNPDHSPAYLRHPAAVWTGTRLIMWGGPTTGAGSQGAIYDPASDTWDLDLGATPTSPQRAFSLAVWTGSEMIAWGGSGVSGIGNAGWRFNPTTKTWLPTSTTGAPSPRKQHSAVWTGSEMIVWGGNNGTTRFNTGGRYDPVTDSWNPTSIGSGVPQARDSHVAVWTGSEMLVWGGSTGSAALGSGSRYDPASDSWSPISSGLFAPAARSGHTAVWTGTEMIVWGGSNAGQLYNDGGRYNPAADSWTPTSTPWWLQARQFHSAVWTGSEMIVWGGSGNQSILATGARYDSAQDSWSLTSMQYSPGPVAGHTYVWTGAEALVFGGVDIFDNPLPRGFRFDPATATWSAMSMNPQVQGRSQHSAVWTGTEMIIYGGWGSASQTGGRYNPTTGRWAATGTSGDFPGGRYSHTAVWTGTDMIIWGGMSYATGSNVNAGSRYNPISDSWASISGVNAPAPRVTHTAVWTGTEMIIWGGADDSIPTNSGGRYAPSTDTWSPTSISGGVPTARATHSAVWTGDRMIIWGGHDGVSFVGSGALYDPASDAWAPTAGAPIEERGGHSAVWTGHEMIVFGGVTNGQPQIDAVTHGRYNPSTDSWALLNDVSPVHLPRGQTRAIWTGEEMMLLGGTPSGGAKFEGAVQYCRLCGALHTYYRDQDGDSFGAPGISGTSCDAAPPAGWAVNAADCSDADSLVWSAPVEVQELQVEGGLPTHIFWTDQDLANGPGTSYDVMSGGILASREASLGSAACLLSSGAPNLDDSRPGPPSATAFWYLARARNACGTGTFGTGTLGLDRDGLIPDCP